MPGENTTFSRLARKVAAVVVRLPAAARVALVAAVAASAVGAMGCGGCAGCGGRGSGGADASAAAAPDLHRALALADGAASEPLPPRPEVVSLAEAVEAAAVREGAGARAGELHVLAASLTERVWRVEGKEQDAKEAIDLLRAAAKDPTSSLACDAAVRAARLAGEVAHDAAVTYAELYRAERRFLGPGAAAGGAAGGGNAGGGNAGAAGAGGGDAVGGADAGGGTGGAGGGGACVRTVEDALAALAPFRPPAPVLAAIDQGLLGEGALGPAAAAGVLADAGLGLAAVAGPPHLTGVEPLPGKENARVVLHLDRAARFRVGDEGSVAGKPPRTFVDLDGVDVGTTARTVEVGGIVERVTSEATTTGARVWIDLDGRAYRRVFHLVEPFRVVVDIARNPPGAAARSPRDISRVCVDPGHGGNDPGAIGAAGVKEKDVTLDIAHKVAAELSKDGLAVVLTRDDDRFVSLEDRTARANASGADLFVSVHCNAAPDRAHHGLETYVLDTTKDDIAARVAARENATSQAATQEIGSILASMRLADQATHSTHLAELLQRAALASIRDKYPRASDGGVKTAGFYVLVGARMPAVLFETSYMSNPTEEELLGGDEYRQRLADGIANAVKAYREGR